MKNARFPVSGPRVILLVSALVLTVPLGVAAQPSQDVTVVNPPSAPVPVQEVQVDLRAGSAFQVAITRTLTPGATDLGFTVLTVPTGVRFVIEQLTARVRVETGETGVFSLVNTVGGVLAEHSFQTPFQAKAFGTFNYFVGSHAVRLYADPGTQVRMFVRRRDPDGGSAVGFGELRLTLSGYSVSFP